MRMEAANEREKRIGEENLHAVTDRIDRRLAEGGCALCVIDGMCGAGKTTLAEALACRYDAPVIHMDDFFLPFSMRTPQRLDTPGGNVHHERFLVQVVEGLRTGADFAYQRFDCGSGDLTEIVCPAARVRIVEGSYSLHPAFQQAWADLQAVTVFLSVDGQEQLRRIARRAPEKYQAFVDRWIPLEKKYFQAYDIGIRAQLALTSPSREDLL